ncbi:MAG: molybdopterin converting factor subunit 1 [Micropepsaceae bacterium]
MKLLYFAWLRQHIGRNEETLDVPDSIATVAQLIDWLIERGEGYRAAFADGTRVRVAINQHHVDRDARVRKFDEVAFFPPVTGG